MSDEPKIVLYKQSTGKGYREFFDNNRLDSTLGMMVKSREIILP